MKKFIVLLLCAQTQIFADFYALSSLIDHFYSDIEYKESDISSLWKRVEKEPSYAPDIQLAKQLYEDNDAKCPAILIKLWNREKNCKRLMARSLTYQNFTNNFCIDKSMHKKIAPYLLPLDHPLRAELDALFSVYGVNENTNSMSKAGFITVSFRPTTYVVIVKHSNLPGHLLKLYLESEDRIKKNREGWKWLLHRCEGAQALRNLIKEKNLTHFVVPDKWLYPLPPKPLHSSPQCGQPLVLLCTEMDIVSDQESHEIWQNRITHDVLDELYIILSHGLSSSYVSWNIPPTKDGKFACVDTEQSNAKPNYSLVRNYLSQEMKDYWDRLVRYGGKC